MTDKIEIGLAIKNKRKKAGLKQKQLVKILRPRPISVNTLSRIETGNYNYSIDVLFSISEALDCDISEFCPGKENMDGRKIFINFLEDYLKKMKEEES